YVVRLDGPPALPVQRAAWRRPALPGPSISARGGARQRRTVRSELLEARVLPSGENATPNTPAVWPSREATSCREATLHSRTMSPAEARVLPSGENATPTTGDVCPMSDTSSRPVA